MKFRSILCAALSAALLTSSALAAGGNRLIAPAPVDGTNYTIEERNASPIPVWGDVVALEENRVELKNSDEKDPYSHIVLNVDKDTVILDAVTGAAKTFADLKKDEALYAYVGPAMTRSLPPIAHASLLLCNIPADFAVPTWAEVQSVETGEDGTVSALMSGAVILHMNEKTEVRSAPGVTAATLADVRPGSKVLAWYSVVALSMPAQATPTQIMVFPYGYNTWCSASPAGVSLAGKALSLSADQTPFAADGKLVVPVRAMAEALGCTVLWDAAHPEAVTIQKDGATLYTFQIGGDTATLADDSAMGLAHKPLALNGVTFLAIEDVLTLHNLKLSAV